MNHLISFLKKREELFDINIKDKWVFTMEDINYYFVNNIYYFDPIEMIKSYNDFKKKKQQVT